MFCGRESSDWIEEEKRAADGVTEGSSDRGEEKQVPSDIEDERGEETVTSEDITALGGQQEEQG